jgi:hypothetical protein
VPSASKRLLGVFILNAHKELTMRKKKSIIVVFKEIFERMRLVEKTNEQHHAEWNNKFMLTREQFEQLVQSKLDRMPLYRHQVDKDEFHDLL